jgi:hypothetical protein
MKGKMPDHVQPRESVLLRKEQAQQEIQNFLFAVSSYPERAEKDPALTFRQHLCSVLATSDDRSPRS